MMSRNSLTDEVTKRSLAMAPFRAHTEHFRPIESGDLCSQGIEELSAIRLLQLFVALGLVDCHVIDTKMQLTEGEQSIVDVLGLDEVVDQVIWNLLRRLRLPGSLLFPGGEVLGRQGRVMLA